MTHADRTLAENTILALAARKYIYKSEMRALLSSLSDKTVTLPELEALLFSLIDMTVIYVDDDPVNPDTYVPAVSLKRKLKRQGFDSLHGALGYSQPVFFPEMLLIFTDLLNENKAPFLKELGEILSEPQRYEHYLLLETAEFFFEILDRLAEDGHILDLEEQARLVDRVAEHMDVPAEEAAALLAGGLRELGILMPEPEILRDLSIPDPGHTEETAVNMDPNRDRRE